MKRPAVEQVGLLVDAVLVLGLAVLAGHVWGECSVGSEVAGDSYVALECGRRWLDGGFARPVQPIFGWGLCASYAPLFAGAGSLAEVAWRRALAASVLVPATYVFLRAVLPSLLRPTPIALRAAALIGSLAVFQNETLGRATSSGSHGYLAFTWVALAFALFAFATRERTGNGRGSLASAAVPAVLASVAVPMAMMNHPYSGWLAPVAVVLLPLLVRRAGWVTAGLSVLVGGAVSLPRILQLVDQFRNGATFGSMAHQPGDWSLGEGELVGWLTDPRLLAFFVGLGVLALLPLLVRGTERRWAAVSWTLAGVAAAASLFALGSAVGYVQDYHALLAFPFPALGIAVAAALLVDGLSTRWWRRTAKEDAPPTRPPDPTPPVDLRLAGARSIWALAVSAALLALILQVTATAEGSRSLTDPWCTTGPGNGGTAVGNRAIEEAVVKDLVEKVPPRTPILLTNLNVSDNRLDSMVAVGMALMQGGLDWRRMVCCRASDPPPVWYLLVDVSNAKLEYRSWGDLDGADVLLDRPEVDELLVAVRTPQALAAIGEQLCAAIDPDRVVAAHYYREWMDWLTSGGMPGVTVPPSPIPDCLQQM